MTSTARHYRYSIIKIVIVILSVCPSVCLSHWSSTLKQLDISKYVVEMRQSAVSSFTGKISQFRVQGFISIEGVK